MKQQLEQTQGAIQTQQLSSLQVAVAKMVELPITELAMRVRDEMVDNAALEEKENDGSSLSDGEVDDYNSLHESNEQQEDDEREDRTDATTCRPTMCPTIYNNEPTKSATARTFSIQTQVRSTKNCKNKLANTISMNTSNR